MLLRPNPSPGWITVTVSFTFRCTSTITASITTQNLGTTEMRFLAVTDFRLSQRAYLGDPTDYRLHADVDGKRRR